MNFLEKIQRPTKLEQKIASDSYTTVASAMSKIHSANVEIEIEETNDRIQIPFKALEFLSEILKAMGEGQPVSIVPIAAEVTTQKAAEILGCSRPHLVKLLESGAIDYTKVGKHRRIRFEDVIKYKQRLKDDQKQHLIDMMNEDEDSGLYDT